MKMAFDNKHWCYDRMKCFDFNGETHVLLKHFQLNSTSNLRQSIGFSIFIPRTRKKIYSWIVFRNEIISRIVWENEKTSNWYSVGHLDIWVKF